MLSNGELLIPLRRQINFDRDQKRPPSANNWPRSTVWPPLTYRMYHSDFCQTDNFRYFHRIPALNTVFQRTRQYIQFRARRISYTSSHSLLKIQSNGIFHSHLQTKSSTSFVYFPDPLCMLRLTHLMLLQLNTRQ
jgi:hypothetical protein